MQTKCVTLLITVLLGSCGALQCRAQEDQPAQDAATSPSDSPQAPEIEDAWPGFDAPAIAIVEFFLLHRQSKKLLDTLGMSGRDVESRVEQELKSRPQEFASALVAAMPRGFSAWKAIEQQDEQLLHRLTSARVLPSMAGVLPPEFARGTITAIQNDAARLGRMCINRIERYLRRSLQDEDFEGLQHPDHAEAKYFLDILSATLRIDRAATRGAARATILIQPYLQIWPRIKSDQEKRRAVSAKYATERAKFFERFPPLREDEIVFLRKNVDRIYDLDWYRINRDKFDGMSAQEIALKVWDMMRGGRTPFWPSYSLEEFFDGNTYDSSIAPNLVWDHPGIETFYYVLRNIRAKPEVLDVRITRHPDSIDAPDGGWMSADCIWLWTRGVDLDTVLEWLKPLKVTQDWLSEAGECDAPLFGPPLEEGVRVFAASWD